MPGEMLPPVLRVYALVDYNKKFFLDKFECHRQDISHSTKEREEIKQCRIEFTR